MFGRCVAGQLIGRDVACLRSIVKYEPIVSFRNGSAWVQGFARFGFAVGGVVYLLIGVVAVLVAFEKRGRPSGPQGAIERIGEQPFGHILLLIVAMGLLGYALWCFVQALFDTDRDGNNLKGIALRVGEFSCGLGYVGLALVAFHRMLGLAYAWR